MSNTSKTTVSLESILRAPSFRQGVRHYRKGVEPIFDDPWSLEGRGRQNGMWTYERGRLFAAFAKGIGVAVDEREFFVNRRLHPNIRNLARDAFYAGVFH